MLTLTLIAAVAAYAWFFYTDRLNTLTTTRYIGKATAKTIKNTVKTVALEANIAKESNTLADLKIDSKDRDITRDAIVDVDSLFASMGLDTKHYTSRTAKLAGIKQEISDLTK